MFDRFSDHTKLAMSGARKAAHEINHEWIGTEHLLLGVVRVKESVAAGVLQRLGVDLARLERDVLRTLKPGKTLVPLGQLPFTPRAKRVLELTMYEASEMEHDNIGTGHLLLGLLGERRGVAAQAMTNLGVNLEDVRRVAIDEFGYSPEADGVIGPEGYRVTSRTVWTHWYENGHPQSEGCYRGQERQGEWTFWHEDGSVDRERSGVYDDDRLIDTESSGPLMS